MKALRRTLAELGVDSGILDAVESVNEAQKELLVRQVTAYYGGDLQGRTFALWGLSFKPDTNDMREAPALVIIEQLLGLGASLRAHDPEALENARRYYGDRHGPRLTLHEHNYEALDGADGLLIVTEWKQYRVPDFRRMKSLLREPVIFDGRNLFEPGRMSSLGFDYTSVGRPAVRRADPAQVA